MITPGDEAIPGYRVVKLLGRGQFGQVWQAHSPGGTSLALKFIDLNGRQGWKEFRAIQRVKQIRHAHLMPIVAIWLLDEQGSVIDDDAVEGLIGSHYETTAGKASEETLIAPVAQDSRKPAQLIVATLVANMTLGDRLRECRQEGRKGIPVDELLRYMVETAKGLDFLNSPRHNIGSTLGAVQHSDVKPDNIMLLGESVVITDFGVAQTLAESRTDATATSMGGTPAFMSPESFLSKTSHTSDQYSLAITYYMLRTGRLPFHEETYAAVYEAHQSGKLELSGITAAERKVLKKAAATAPQDRFGSCTEFVEQLQSAIHPDKTARRKPLTLLSRLALLTLTCLLVGGVVWAAMVWRPIPPQKTSQITLLIEPADATLMINGHPVEVASGQAILQRKPGELLSIVLSKPPEWEELSDEIVVANGDKECKLSLTPAAIHYVVKAEQSLAANDLTGAVAAYRQAIKLNPEQFGQLPEPITASVDGAVRRLVAASDSRRILVADDLGVKCWRVDNSRLELDPTVSVSVGEPVAQLVAQGAQVGWSSEYASSVSLQDSKGRSETLPIDSAAGQIKQIALLGDGRWLAATSEVLDILVTPERRAVSFHVWDLGTRNLQASYQQLLLRRDEMEPKLVVPAGNKWAVLAAYDFKNREVVVRKVEIDSGRESTLYKQPGEIQSLAVSNDGNRVAIAGAFAAEHDAESKSQNRVVLLDVRSGRSQPLQFGHDDAICSIAFSPAGNMMAAGDNAGKLQLWTLPKDWDGSKSISLHPVFLSSSPASAARDVFCLDASWLVVRYDNGEVILWECSDTRPRPTWLATREMAATSLVITPDQQWIVTGHADGKISCWPVLKTKMIIEASAGMELKPKTDDPST